MVKYTISINNLSALLEWVVLQPNQIQKPEIQNGNTIVCEFNHTTQSEQLAFKRELVKRLFTMDDGSILESIFKNLEQIQTDQFVFVTESQQTKTNIGTTYVDIFPASINGNPIPIDTTGFTKVGIQLFWNKNAGTSNHDFRIINDADDTKVLYEKLNISSTITEDFNIALNGNFTNFVGKLRIQAKAGNATDDPIFLGLRLYLRR